jgi:adenine-specific DNA-methyltransferase
MSELGQVFTPSNVARLMGELLFEDVDDIRDVRILDPCIGQNIFLETISRHAPNIQMEGVELDASLISESTKSFYERPNRKLNMGNFFEYSKFHESEFDYIISNPPYVRQEKMAEENDKKYIRSMFKDKSYKLPANSNLYVYFLLKSIDLLNEGGKLVTIVYDSWLYSSYGGMLKDALSSVGSIESVIHFQNRAFANADVGATIIEFKKGVGQTHQVRSASYADAAEINGLSQIKWDYVPSTELVASGKVGQQDSRLVQLGAIAEINRGTSALSNKLFVFKEKEFEETIPFLKSIKDMSDMTAESDKHLLVVRNIYAQKTSSYLEKIKNHILQNDKEFNVLSKEIRKNKFWYSLRLAKPGDIIFNYYLRDSFDFILNLNRLQSSDNFYNLRFDANLYEHFALLNSTFVKNSVLRNSRMQGRGLRKVQLYEFKNVLIPNLERFSMPSIKKLATLGKQLAKQPRNSVKKMQIVVKIDEVLHLELNSGVESQEIIYSNKQYGTTVV